MYYCCAITDKGRRPHNEDALLIHKTVLLNGVTECELHEPFLIAVADGVSGEQSGEIASSACLNIFLRKIVGNLPLAIISPRTCPGPTLGSCELSPTSIRWTPGTSALSRALKR